MKKRSWVDISINILESAETSVSKTRLMYRSNMNFGRFNPYFEDFLQKGLLKETHNNGNGTAYLISNQGKVLLTALKNAERLFHESQAPIKARDR